MLSCFNRLNCLATRSPLATFVDWATSMLTLFRWLFWLAGIASYTAALGGGKRCGRDDIVYCNQLVAAEAFGWIEWILFSVAFIVIILLGGNAIRRGDSLSGGLV